MYVYTLSFSRLIKEFGDTDIMRFQVGLGHAFSRSKIRTDPNRQDKPVQNAVALLENVRDFFLFFDHAGNSGVSL